MRRRSKKSGKSSSASGEKCITYARPKARSGRINAVGLIFACPCSTTHSKTCPVHIRTLRT
jgi:hypothetical protein